MDMQGNAVARSPRKEIQGPRPAPLRVRKDSHKIRKPPMAPPPATAAAAAEPPAPPRPPLIIYTVSPKIIHASPNEFMSVVQRLTGPNYSSATYNVCSPSAAPSPFPFQENGGAVSPAARLASIEKIKSPEGRKTPQIVEYDEIGAIEGIEMGSEIRRTANYPGILSPNPNSLPPIPPNFFSSSFDHSNPFGFLPEFSPINSEYINSSNNINNYIEMNNGFTAPSTLFSPQISMPSPQTLHLFNTLFDL